ncbi:unnamed protein product [Clonostachys rhizophaga]|uniref:Uncharacterized protein n=1 Tax=Clonostachys rhizophaga TaxID=160324 RepID=A0A9N9V8B1_9HYPO|nr:unnamed protein product [Clonostachys rhizophaga]
MAHQGLAVDDVGLPMVIDGGRRGLESSVHRPLAGLSDKPEPTECGNDEDIEKKAYHEIASLVWQIVETLLEKTRQRARNGTKEINTRDLNARIDKIIEKSIEKNIAKALQPAGQSRNTIT